MLFDSYGEPLPQWENDWQYWYAQDGTNSVLWQGDQEEWSSRRKFIRQFESSQFRADVLQDDCTILCAVLGIINYEWARLVADFEFSLRDDTRVMHAARHLGEYELELKLKQSKYLRQNLEMLRICHTVIQAQRDRLADPGSVIAREFAYHTTDFEDYIGRTSEHIERIARRLEVFSSIKAIHQAEDIEYDIVFSCVSRDLWC